MGQKPSRQPGDRTLEYGVDTPLTVQFTNKNTSNAARDLYSRKNSNPDYFMNMFGRLYPLNTAGEQIELSKMGIYEFVGVFTERMEDALAKLDVPVVTPWEVELAKERAGLTALLGPVRTKLPILVIVDNQEEYVHECSEDLMFGILSVIDAANASNRFKFYIDNGEPVDGVGYSITIFDIAANYVSRKVNKRYVAVTFLGEATFDTIDVIQGIITASSWLREDPHKYIGDIFRDGVPVTF